MWTSTHEKWYICDSLFWDSSRLRETYTPGVTEVLEVRILNSTTTSYIEVIYITIEINMNAIAKSFEKPTSENVNIVDHLLKFANFAVAYDLK